MPFEPRILGRSGLTVSPVGLGASYGIPTIAVEECFEHGINYLYWGSLRRSPFAQALRNLHPHRRRLVLVLQSFSRIPGLLTASIERGLRSIGYEYADVLLLGFWNSPIAPRILETARELHRRGLVRHLAVSSHNRTLIPTFFAEFDIVHLRYNPVHPGVEEQVFPLIPRSEPPGIVAYTATCWGRLPKKGNVPASDCYRFALSHPAVDLCMAGPASREEARDALRAMEMGPLNAEELARIRQIGESLR